MRNWTRRRWCQGTAATLALPTVLAHAADHDLVVGQIGPFTGIPVPDAPQLNQGAKACFAQLNAKGGISGRKVQFFELDDAYTADGFLKAFAAAMQRKPLALLTPVGSVAIKRMLDDKLLDKHEVVVLNGVPGAEALRSPGHPRFFHIRAGDKQQIERIVTHARTVGVSHLAVLIQDFPMGHSGLSVAQATAQRAGGMTILPFTATPEAESLAKAASRIATSEAQATLVIGAPRFMVDGIAAVRQAGVARFVFALSYIPPGLLVKVAGGAGARGVALAQTYPNPSGISLPLQREFQAAMREAFPDVKGYTSFHLEGYVTAKTFAEAARRGGSASPDALAKALHAMGEVDLGGFRVNFAQGNVGSSFVDIGVVNADGRLMY